MLGWGLLCLPKYVLTLCFAILVKLNVYSLDTRALKKVTRHMKTWDVAGNNCADWAGGFGSEASSVSIRYKIGRVDLWGRAAGGSRGQRGFRKDLAVRGDVAVDIVMGRQFFVRRLASKAWLAAWLSRVDHLETMAVLIFEGPQIFQNDLSWFKSYTL